MSEIGVRHGLSVVQQLGSGGIFIPPSGGGAGPTPTGATGVDFETTDYLSGQSFAGSNLAFDMYYVSGTMPFGLPATTKNTWIPVAESGSYTVENIMQNCEGRMANLTLDSSVDMPMHTGADVAVNNAGADFTLNGVVSTSGRGPNQFNGTASEIDGSNFLTYSDSAANGTLSYWAQNNGIMAHHYSTGAVSITNITSALGDVVGEVFLSQNVISEDKFIDSDGLPIDLGIDGSTPDGTIPSTYFRVRADDPENNQGSGADAVATGAPFVGFRGPSEFWARSTHYDTTQDMSNSTLVEPDSQTISYAFAVKMEATVNNYVFNFENIGASGNSFFILVDGDAQIRIRGRNSVFTSVYNRDSATPTTNQWYVCVGSFDLSDAGKDNFYMNNVSQPASDTFTVAESVGLSSTPVGRVGKAFGGIGMDGDISFMYLTTGYIDFSDESERLKFADGLGYPVNIQPAIDAGDIPQPLFYLPFDEPGDLGKDTSGNDNHFTINGTVTSGSDVTA